jgi:hypothetical protein
MPTKLKLVRHARGTSEGYAVVTGYDLDPRGRPLPRTRFGRREEDQIPVRGPTDVLEVAELFGYPGTSARNGRKLAAARAYLAAHVGAVVRDPGYL